MEVKSKLRIRKDRMYGYPYSQERSQGGAGRLPPRTDSIGKKNWENQQKTGEIATKRGTIGKKREALGSLPLGKVWLATALLAVMYSIKF